MILWLYMIIVPFIWVFGIARSFLLDPERRESDDATKNWIKHSVQYWHIYIFTGTDYDRQSCVSMCPGCVWKQAVCPPKSPFDVGKWWETLGFGDDRDAQPWARMEYIVCLKLPCLITGSSEVNLSPNPKLDWFNPQFSQSFLDCVASVLGLKPDLATFIDRSR